MTFMNDASGVPNVYVSTLNGTKNRRLIVTNGYSPDWQRIP